MSHQYHTLVAMLRAEGFTPGAPPWLSIDEVADDHLSVEKDSCLYCDEEHLDFQPFYRSNDQDQTDGEYRAFACCPSCDAVEEL